MQISQLAQGFAIVVIPFHNIQTSVNKIRYDSKCATAEHPWYLLRLKSCSTTNENALNVHVFLIIR